MIDSNQENALAFTVTTMGSHRRGMGWAIAIVFQV